MGVDSDGDLRQVIGLIDPKAAAAQLQVGAGLGRAGVQLPPGALDLLIAVPPVADLDLLVRGLDLSAHLGDRHRIRVWQLQAQLTGQARIHQPPEPGEGPVTLSGDNLVVPFSGRQRFLSPARAARQLKKLPLHAVRLCRRI